MKLIFFFLFALNNFSGSKKYDIYPLHPKSDIYSEKFSQLQKHKTLQSPSSHRIIRLSNTYLHINRKLKFLSVLEIKPIMETLSFPQLKRLFQLTGPR